MEDHPTGPATADVLETLLFGVPVVAVAIPPGKPPVLRSGRRRFVHRSGEVLLRAVGDDGVAASRGNSRRQGEDERGDNQRYRQKHEQFAQDSTPTISVK